MTLPSGWAFQPLGKLVSAARKRVRPSEFPHYPYIGMENVEAHSMRLLGTVPASTMKSTAVLFKKGDVLYGRLRPYLNKVLTTEFEGLASPEFIAMVPGPNIRARYLQQFLNHSAFVRFATRINTGDRPRVDFQQLKDFPVPVPPLETQDRLVAAIEAQRSRLTVANGSLNKALARVESFVACSTKAALSDGWSAQGELKTLESLVAPGRKIAYGVLQPGSHVADAVPLVRVQDVKGGVLELNEEIKRVDFTVASRFPRTSLEGGELLLTVVGTIGRTAVAGSSLKGANVARAVSVVPLSSDVNPHFVRYSLSTSAAVEELTRKAHEVARKTLNLEDVRKVEVRLPSRAVQDQVVRSLDEVISYSRYLRVEAESAIRRSQVLLDGILSSAFSGRHARA
jgi:type I restriction enzyme, S subunit